MLHEPESQFRHGIVQRLLFIQRQITLRLFLQHSEKVDVVPSQIEVRFLPVFHRNETKIQFRLEPQRVNQKVKICGWQFGLKIILIALNWLILKQVGHHSQFYISRTGPWARGLLRDNARVLSGKARP